MASFVKKYKVIQTSELLEIQRVKASQYKAKVRSYLFKKGVLKETDKIISLSLIENKRSYENPWRYSVSNVEVK